MLIPMCNWKESYNGRAWRSQAYKISGVSTIKKRCLRAIFTILKSFGIQNVVLRIQKCSVTHTKYSVTQTKISGE